VDRRGVRVGAITIGGGAPLVLIAGPCVIESREAALRHAERLRDVAARAGVGLVYKSSFDKANRTSLGGFRGVGMEEGLAILAEVRRATGLAVLTDVHEKEQVARVAAVVDVLQTPAFLCRQTDFVLAVAAAGKPVNLKKGQFLSPGEMARVVEKARSTGNRDILVTERLPSAPTTRSPTCARSRAWPRPAARSCSTPPTACSSRAGSGRPPAASGNSWRRSHARQ
jgi:2-dehydro-3-deoxyphosphooctonate aldolase (KDO 8-P synthase)